MEFNATFFVSIISFIIFTWIMNMIFYKPFGNIISERQKFIEETTDAAKNITDQAEQINAEREERLVQADKDAKELINDTVSKVKQASKLKTDSAKQQSGEDILSAKAKLNAQAKETGELLKGNVKDLAEAISEKILGEYTSINSVDNNIVDEVIK